MAQEPKLGLYSEAICNSERPELASIAAKRVAVIARFQDEAGNWSYTVYASKKKSSPTFVCLENELVSVAPEPLVSDGEWMSNVIAQTAELRHSSGSSGLRRLLRERGYDPMKCLQISLEQGCDVFVTLILPDGTIVSADCRIDPETHQASRFVDWNVETYSNREIELCHEILSKDDTSDFDANVRRYFDEHS